MGRDLKDFLPELELLDVTLGSGKKIYLGGTGASIEGDGTTVTITGSFSLGPIDIAAGTQTTANPMLDATATWNAGAVTFEMLRFVVTDTASAAGSRFVQFRVGATDKFSIDKSGNILTMDGKIKEYAGAAPTNGQILMGHTANSTLEIGTLTGTANQVTVTNGAGSITLATPQDIATSSTPQFARLGLGAAADAASLLKLTGGTVTTDAPLILGTQTWNDAAVTFNADSVTITSTASAAASTVLKRVVGAATVFSVGKGGNIATDGKVTEYAGAAPTDGQVLMGHTANGTLEIGTLTGTANQITVTGGAGSVTLATPQNLDTAAAVQFGSGGFGVVAGAAGTLKMSAKCLLYNNAAPTDGQLLIGDTAEGAFDAATLTGTANQVTVTNGAGSITLATPQNIHTAATPQFGGLGLGGAADAASKLSLTGGTVVTSAPLILGTQTWNAGAVTFDADSVTITNTASAAGSTVLKRVVGAATVFSVEKSGNITTDGKVIEYAGAAPTDGQLLIGDTAEGAFDAATLTGTANQITVTNGAGSITLSTPQDINTGATPQFARMGLGVAADAATCLKMSLGAGFTGIDIVQGGATESSAGNGVAIEPTWNNAANAPFALSIDVTNTASHADARLINAAVAAASKFSVDVTGNLTKAGHWVGQVFNINAFQYPAPGTDFTPGTDGAHLAASLVAKKVWLPLNCVKQGDVITTYRVRGNVVSGGNAVTVDAALYKCASDGTNTAIVNGGMVQVSKVANYTMNEVVNNDDATVAADEMFYIEFTGTTGAACTIDITGVEVTANRK